jgi:TonB family protein
MNPKKLILAAALLGGLLSATAFATTVDSHQKIIASTHLVAPVPAQIVHPVDLPRSYEGATVTLSLTIDATGLPHDIKVVSRGDRAVSKSLIAAVSQWKFTPGLLNGLPVTTKVTLPLQLEEA